MKKLFFLTALCLVAVCNAYGGTDVTDLLLKNADFSAGPVVSADICGYTHDMTGDDVYGLQDVNNWGKVILRDDPGQSSTGSGMGGGVFAYGSSNKLRGYNVSAPSAGPEGNAGNCLAFFAVWSCGGYYYQNVTLAPGKYTITVPVYNGSGSQAYESYIGFISDGGERYVISESLANGSWQTKTTEVSVSEITTGKIVLGYLSTGGGSANAQHLFFDKVQIVYGDIEDDDEEEDPSTWVDCTSYIQNPGFDEDISFNNDATASKTASQVWTWADEFNRTALVAVSDDGSIYSMGSDESVPYNKFGNSNWYGFKATIKGWETTNKSDTAIWIYYGSLPYDMEDGALCLGHSEQGSEIIPEKPAEIATPENKGVLYLKAGWLNECSYKQVVKNLSRAKYRVTYYIRNTNAGSWSYAEATNLCNVTCNGVRFVDDEGFNSEGWIKHTIEFIPVDSFSIEFGCRTTDDYSYRNPILWVDGIKLYKIGDATDEDVDDAYKELVDKAQALLDKLHFAADRRAMQEAMQAFASDKDYVALYQAIQMAIASEEKYSEITAEDGLIRQVNIKLNASPSVYSDGAKQIVGFASDKVAEWIVSDMATYLDADDYVARIDAYANLYAPVYMEAERKVAALLQSRTEALRQLMTSQKASLTASAMLEVEVVNEYVDALRDAMADAESIKKCAAPVIGYEKGVLKFTSDTENVEFVSKITDTDINEYRQSEITLTVAYYVSVYARKDGYDDSDVSTVTLCWIDKEPDTDETSDISARTAIPVMVQGRVGSVTIMGAEDGTRVVVYTADGTLVGSSVSMDRTAVIPSHLKKGSIVIVKIDDKSVKAIIR